MANYFSRVELHKVEEGEDSYNVLHTAMEECGFVRKSDEINKKLPDGSYLLINAKSYAIADLISVVRNAVKKTGKEASIVVVRFATKDDIGFNKLETADAK